MTLPMEDEELYNRTAVNVPIPDIGEQDPIAIPPPVARGGRESQADDELLTHRASQDPSQPLQSQADDADPPPMQWKTLQEAPPVMPQAPLKGIGAPLMPQAGASDVTLQQRAEMPKGEDSGGFDWSRAFFALGKGDLGAFDAERARRRNEPMEQALNQEKLNAYSMQRQAARDAIDPGSKTSLAAQQEFADIMRGRAEQLRQMGKNVLAKEFDAWAERAPQMHAVQIANALKSPRMSEVLRAIDSQSRNNLAEASLGVRKQEVGSTIQDRLSDNARQREQLEEQVRHNKAVEANQGNRFTAKLEKDQEKLNEKVAGLNEQEELLSQVAEQKGKVNTGFFSNKLQQGLKYIGLEDKDFDQLEATLAGVTNQIIKLQAGGNVTAGEALRMRQQLPSPDMDEPEFNAKLAAVVNQIALKKKNAAKQYERMVGGDVRDQAPIGHELVDKQNGSGGKPPAPPPGTAPGFQRRNKNTGETWTWDGEDWTK